MKRSQQCPKCESRDVGYYENALGSTDTLHMGRDVESQRWACVSCGYVEAWIKEPRELVSVDHFHRVNETRKDQGPFR